MISPLTPTSRLLIAGALAGVMTSAAAEADGPDMWRVSGVSSGDQLNVRSGPSTGFRVIGSVPADATQLRNMGCHPNFTTDEWAGFNDSERQLAATLRWCRIEYQGLQGWVAGRFLREY